MAAFLGLLIGCVQCSGLTAADESRVETREAAPAAAEQPATQQGITFFEERIRPVLVEKCYKCHSARAEKLRGNLYLDTRAGARKGGDLGPAVVPRDPQGSMLIQAIHQMDD